MELLVFLNYMNCCSLSVMLGRGVLIPPPCLNSFSLSYSASELPAICYAGWKTERKIKLRGGWQEGGRKKQIRQTHWNNSSDLILHRWLQEAHWLCFVSSCFSHVWFFLSCRSPPFSPCISADKAFNDKDLSVSSESAQTCRDVQYCKMRHCSIYRIDFPYM